MIDRAAAFYQFLYPLQLRHPQCGLQVGHLVFEPEHLGPELALLPAHPAVIGQAEHVLVELGVVGDEHAALARGHGLGAVEGKRAKCAHRPGAPAVVDRAHRFCRVFNDGDAKFLAQSQQFIHMAQIAVEMDRDDGLGARGNRRAHCLRVKAPCIGQNIDQHRLGTQVHHGCDAGYPVRVRQDHLITRPNA